MVRQGLTHFLGVACLALSFQISASAATIDQDPLQCQTQGANLLQTQQAVRRSVVAPPQAHTLNSRVQSTSWAHGAASWQEASITDGDEDLWQRQNYCDARVLHSSAPLTVLFGISTFWSEIKKRRAALALIQAPPSAGKPLEIHVLGSAYPFEGRSDWSLLASRRPPDVPAVRVVLVLGTPWHQDNVPVMNAAKEFDERRSFLMQFGAKVRKPEIGKIADNGAIQCRNKGSLQDKTFAKADLCRDHGNGLEVVCIEKYYQECSAELPKPDAVVMFSPGFPQIARRSWDQVLQGLLAEEVPIMVGDLLYSSSVKSVFQKNKVAVSPGSKWAVSEQVGGEYGQVGEDGMTLNAMRAYGARNLGAFRNPFPILITRGSHDVTAKNAVLQVFCGRVASAEPLTLPSKQAIQHRKKVVAAMDLQDSMDDASSAEEIKSSMLLATSTAYDKAMWQTYQPEVAELVREFMARKRQRNKPIDKAWLLQVEKMGLTGKPRQKPWNLEEWIFVLEKMKVADEW